LTQEQKENNIPTWIKLVSNIVADVTYFVALPFVAAEDGVPAGDPVE
jgi:hypothetical protein